MEENFRSTMDGGTVSPITIIQRFDRRLSMSFMACMHYLLKLMKGYQSPTNLSPIEESRYFSHLKIDQTITNTLKNANRAVWNSSFHQGKWKTTKVVNGPLKLDP